MSDTSNATVEGHTNNIKLNISNHLHHQLLIIYIQIYYLSTNGTFDFIPFKYI